MCCSCICKASSFVSWLDKLRDVKIVVRVSDILFDKVAVKG